MYIFLYKLICTFEGAGMHSIYFLQHVPRGIQHLNVRQHDF